MPVNLCPWHPHQKSAPITGTRKPVPISHASDIQFGTNFFRYQFLVINKTMLYFVPDLWYGFSGMCVMGISHRLPLLLASKYTRFVSFNRVYEQQWVGTSVWIDPSVLMNSSESGQVSGLIRQCLWTAVSRDKCLDWSDSVYEQQWVGTSAWIDPTVFMDSSESGQVPGLIRQC